MFWCDLKLIIRIDRMISPAKPARVTSEDDLMKWRSDTVRRGQISFGTCLSDAHPSGHLAERAPGDEIASPAAQGYWRDQQRVTRKIWIRLSGIDESAF
jgi:hypothetical protein